jgi:fluoroquinolone transport system permease protein
MSKYLNIIKFEFRTIFRDKMTMMLLVMPFFMLAMSAFLIPALLNSAEGNQTVAKYGSIVAFITFVSMGVFILSAMLAFVLLDRKDERTLFTIAATPLSVKGYIIVQVAYHFLLAVLMNLIVIGGTKLFASDSYSYTVGDVTVRMFQDMTFGKIVVFSIISSLYMPGLGLFLAGVSKNKIEGFAYMKMSGFLIFIPLLLLIEAFNGGLQYVLGIAPNFWSIKALMNTVTPGNSADLNFWWYMLIGAVYSILIAVPAYKFFIKRSLNV